MRVQQEQVNAAERDEFARLLGPAEAAEWLGVSVAWVRDHATRKSPRIPAVKAGKLLRFRPVDVKSFIKHYWRSGDLEAYRD